MSEELKPCAECGMQTKPGEYHPYAACLMFKACHNSKTVRANLDFIRNTRPDSKPEYKWQSVADWVKSLGRTDASYVFIDAGTASEAGFSAARETK